MMMISSVAPGMGMAGPPDVGSTAMLRPRDAFAVPEMGGGTPCSPVVCTGDTLRGLRDPVQQRADLPLEGGDLAGQPGAGTLDAVGQHPQHDDRQHPDD